MSAAAEAIRRGEVVAFPTDTFFALGADALNERAVAKIFSIKGRSEGRPVPVLVASVESVRALSGQPIPAMESLAEAFWPGPLTIVVPAASTVPQNLTAGTPTVGVRVPDHPVALEVVRRAGTPVTGTSANPSGLPPTKDAAQIEQWFPTGLGAVVHAPCGTHAVPSTVVDLCTDPPRIIRAGAITLDALRNVLPGVTDQSGR